ncbi:MAG: hypothetical protein GY913_25450 [Proteobacteria bacterium]|nr:hypothetical protein [Pseudomonadota bacterium]MCP4920260.1 hypothetical protein [Pseudomonadota bacterium]
MDLSPEELAELGRFFLKRFPDPEERALLVAEAGVSDADTWEAVVFAAAEVGKLGDLATAAVDRRPKDTNLEDLVRTLGADSVLSPKTMLIAAVALSLIVLGAAGWYGVADDRIDAKPDDPRALKLAEPVTAALPIEPAPVEPAPVEPVVEPPVERAVDPAVEPESVPEPMPSPPTEEEPIVPGDPSAGRCGGPADALVGYWYAGHPFEPTSGDEYTLKFGKFVRAEYPHRDNGWRADAEVRCTLRAGDTIKLSANPILVDGGKYWVPLVAGDLLTP